MTRDDGLSIGDLAAACDRSVHTLRYYEAEGLIPHVRRNAAGHRRYTAEHVDWMRLLERLRASGMPVARMREYANLAEAGAHTARARIELLRRHQEDVRSQIRELERCLEVVDAKIGYYRRLQHDPEAVWGFPE